MFDMFEDDELPIELKSVFTPAAVAKMAYLCREQPERSLRKALIAMDKQVLVHGPAGSGKSSLVRHILYHSRINPVIVNCTSFTSYEGIRRETFSKLDEKKREKQTDDLLAYLLERKNRVLLLEDFHQLSAGTMTQVIALAKTISSHEKAILQARMLLCGNVDMMGEEGALFNAVHVPAMSHTELEQMVIKGETLLNIMFSDELRASFLKYAGSNARELHGACYRFCKENNIVRRGEKTIYFDDIPVFHKV